MERKYFNFSDVLGYGWRVMTNNFWFFVGLGFLFIIITYLPTAIRFGVSFMHLPRALDLTAGILLQIAGWAVSMVLSIGIIKIALSFCNEQKPPIETLFAAGDCFWRYVGTMILYSLIMYAGILLLIFPGIIWAVKFSLCRYFVVEKGLGPIEALKASSRTTMGMKWDMFAFGIVCAGISILGMICFLIGMFATYPIIMVANALVYRQLMAQTPELAQFGIGSVDLETDGTTLLQQ